MQKPRVAICQPYIILGGRLQVILGIVKALNRLEIEPDILTLGLAFQPDQIEQKYGQNLKMHFRPIVQGFPWRRIPQDYQILLFNFLLKIYAKDYDLLVDSGNSQIFLPKKPRILSYIHFPREYLIKANVPDINHPDLRLPILSFANFSRNLLKLVYWLSKPQLDHFFVCNSRFTRNSLLEIFPDLPDDIKVIYPPINISEYECDSRVRERAVVSLGRFAPDKGQLEQIKLAEKLPDITFHLMGFVDKPNYFELCKRYVKDHQLQNVYLYPNIAFEEMIFLLKSSKYFLHTLINEHFGITAVQAIAAGCLPIVHDSGGQRETVPFEELRFKNMEEVPQILNQLELKNQVEIDNMVKKLQKNANDNFEESVFQSKITMLLKEILNFG